MTDRPVDFGQAFSDFVRSTGRWRDVEPDALVQRWRKFAGDCAAGYAGDSDDYFNDLTVRSTLAKALNELSLNDYPEIRELEIEVAEIDAMLRPLMRTDAFPKFPPDEWWNRGVVELARPRLVAELRERCGVQIGLSGE
jgi:hypothetical protein